MYPTGHSLVILRSNFSLVSAHGCPFFVPSPCWVWISSAYGLRGENGCSNIIYVATLDGSMVCVSLGERVDFFQPPVYLMYLLWEITQEAETTTVLYRHIIYVKRRTRTHIYVPGTTHRWYQSLVMLFFLFFRFADVFTCFFHVLSRTKIATIINQIFSRTETKIRMPLSVRCKPPFAIVPRP